MCEDEHIKRTTQHKKIRGRTSPNSPTDQDFTAAPISPLSNIKPVS